MAFQRKLLFSLSSHNKMYNFRITFSNRYFHFCQNETLSVDAFKRVFIPPKLVGSIMFPRPFSLCNLLFKKLPTRSSDYLSEDNLIDGDDDIEEVQDYEELVKRTFRIPDTCHQVMVIQPYIKWGPSKKRNTTPELQLNEAVALIETLSGWKVVEKTAISLTSFNKKTFFGKGNLELVQNNIKKNELITAVFVSVNILSPSQHRTLEEFFCVPVYDRYTIVVQIFKQHAVTKEAQIQVAMAEIPYLWSHLKGDHEGATDRLGGGTASIGGAGETFIEVRKRVLTLHEKKMKNALTKIRNHRELLRAKRIKQEIPIVAVVGYTNAGKTSLIKALTGEEKLQPKNQLFATLDVTVHEGTLPSKIKVVYVDTVGFISDIPTSLIEAFVATLEDALLADVIIHIQDVSHPDIKNQHNHVMETLQNLKLSKGLLENIILVGNKSDLLPEIPEDDNCIHVSCVSGFGLQKLKMMVENVLLNTTERSLIRIRVRNGGPESRWLYKEATVVNVTADKKDSNYLNMDVIITEVNLSKFKYSFINKKLSS